MTYIQQRRDLASTWASVNPVLRLGEVGWERDTLKVKLGDGVTAWNDLDYAVDIEGAISDHEAEADPHTQYLKDADAAIIYAPITSPEFAGNPKAPTPTVGDSDTSIATTGFVQTAVDRIRITCTSTTRPPHLAGQTIYETDTKRELTSDGTDWFLTSHFGNQPESVVIDVASVVVAPGATTNVHSASLNIGSTQYRRLAGSFTFDIDVAGTGLSAATIRLKANGTTIAEARYNNENDNPTVPRTITITCPMSTGVFTGTVALVVEVANDAGSADSMTIRHLTGRFLGVSC